MGVENVLRNTKKTVFADIADKASITTKKLK
jgi:hypothetical protein